VRPVVLVSALLTSAACAHPVERFPDPQQPPSPPSIFLDTSALEFGEVPVGRAAPVQTVRVGNSGGSALDLRAVALAGADESGSFMLENLTDVGLQPGQQAEFDVVFEPQLVGPIEQEVVVSSTDPSQPEVVFEVMGTGLGGVLHPALTWASGPVGIPVDCEVQATLSVRNLGNADLVVNRIAVRSADSWLALSVDDSALPATLGPYEARSGQPLLRVTTRVIATERGPFTASLEVASDDPLSPTTRVDIAGSADPAEACRR